MVTCQNVYGSVCKTVLCELDSHRHLQNKFKRKKMVQVTKEMLDAGYEEVLKVAKQKGLMWALKWFPRSFINTILTEGFIKMYDKMNATR